MTKRRLKSGKASFRVAWRDTVLGKPQSETFPGHQETAAKAFLRDVEACGGSWPPGWVPGQGYPPPSPNPSGFTVRAAAIKAVHVNRKANAGTKADYLREINRYLPESDPLAAMFIEGVTIQDVEEWHSRLESMQRQRGGPKSEKRKVVATTEPLSAKTRRNAHSRLSSGLSLMVRYGHLSANPALGLGPPPSKTRKIQALTPQEYLLLLPYIAEHYRPLVETLARTGMRFGEATALTARSVVLNSKDSTIYVAQAWKRTEKFGRFVKGAPKSTAGFRTVPIDSRLRATLVTILEGKEPDQEVFTTPDGTIVRHNNFHARIWRPAALEAHKAGAVTFVPKIHDLRHAHATWLLMEGVPVHTVADRLGHDPAVLLREYAHIIGHERTIAPDTIARLLDANAKSRPKPAKPKRNGPRSR